MNLSYATVFRVAILSAVVGKFNFGRKGGFIDKTCIYVAKAEVEQNSQHKITYVQLRKRAVKEFINNAV